MEINIQLENAALFIRLGLPYVEKTEFFKNALQTTGLWKQRLYVLVWTENILKTELSETMTSR